MRCSVCPRQSGSLGGSTYANSLLLLCRRRHRHDTAILPTHMGPKRACCWWTLVWISRGRYVECRYGCPITAHYGKGALGTRAGYEPTALGTCICTSRAGQSIASSQTSRLRREAWGRSGTKGGAGTSGGSGRQGSGRRLGGSSTGLGATSFIRAGKQE